MPNDVQAVGHALIDDHDWDVDVLDLVFDSVLDDTAGLVDGVRSLRFAGPDREVEVDVRGHVYLSVDLRIRPDDPVAVSALAKSRADPGTVTWQCERELACLPAGLTSFLFEWSQPDRRPARTAWVLL